MLHLRMPWMLLLIPLLIWFLWRKPYYWGIPAPAPRRRLGQIFARLLPMFLLLLLGLASSGPEWRKPMRGSAPVLDFAIVLDASSSMRIQDSPPTDRWTAARKVLRAFVKRRPEDRFALILFSAHPVTLSPLTLDHERLLKTLDELDLDARDDGTAIGSALMTAVRRLSTSPARSRVMILLSDGEQNRGSVTPEEAAQAARQAGIRVHTVAMGRKGQSLVPLDGGGQVWLQVSANPESLLRIAKSTGGVALEAEDPAGLERSLAAIDQLEKTVLPVDPPTESQALGQWLLALAVLLAIPLLLDLFFKRGRPVPEWAK